MVETTTVGEFVEQYDISLEDLVTLNYFEDVDDILEEGQQIFVPLNRVEAEERGLIKKKQFVMLDLPRKMLADDTDLERTLSGSEQPNNNIPPQPGIDIAEESPNQVVITAEESQKRLEELVQAKKEAEIAAVKAKELAEQAEAARLAQIEAAKTQQAEEARLAQIEVEKQAEAARLAQIESEKKAEILAKAEAEDQARKKTEAAAAEQQRLQDIASSCGTDKCYHEGKCWTKPENAVCAPTDPHNARICSEGFIDTGKTCISKTAHEQRTAQATGPKQHLDVLNQWYFNPYNDGYGGNGWA
jgi:hypothetical protein